MSAFVVRPTTLARIVAGFVRSAFINQADPFYGLAQAAGFADLDKRDGRQALIARLHEMNVRAVCYRYESDKPSDYPTPDISTLPAWPSPIQFYRSLSCLLYQCSEGNVPDEPLYQAMEMAKGYLARSILDDLAEAEGAEWG